MLLYIQEVIIMSEKNVYFLRVRLTPEKRRKLSVLAALENSTMTGIVNNCIDRLIQDNDAMKKLESDFNLEGMFTEGDPIPKEAIDEVIREWEKE